MCSKGKKKKRATTRQFLKTALSVPIIVAELLEIHVALMARKCKKDELHHMGGIDDQAINNATKALLAQRETGFELCVAIKLHTARRNAVFWARANLLCCGPIIYALCTQPKGNRKILRV